MVRHQYRFKKVMKIMINKLNSPTSQIQVDDAGYVESFVPIGGSLDRSVRSDGNLGQVYESLKKMWEENPQVCSMDIINQVRNFTNADGEKPYSDISTHIAVVAQVMNKWEGESGGETPFYASLNESLGFAVVSNSILNSFLAKMRERPEEPEPW